MPEHERLIERAWARKGFGGRLLRAVLRPASVLFSGWVRLRALSYRLRLRPRRRLRAAVISVGNLSVGGTGKTPTALWVAESLRSRGYGVAILSRGYGGRARRATIVGEARDCKAAATLDWREVGDENVLLARRFRGPVVVARRRADAGRLACREFGVDVLVLDDGFQHLKLFRDFDLVCLRASTSGDDVPLPAGRLREPLSAIRRADAVLVTKAEPEENLAPEVERRVAKLPVFRGDLRASALVTPSGGGWHELPLGRMGGRRALALAGIADPGHFYQTLHEWDVHVVDFIEFRDHHAYTHEDWKAIAFRSRELDLLVTTEKDLVKLDRFPFAKEKLVAVRVSMEVEEGDRLMDLIVKAVEASPGRAKAKGGAR